MKSIRTPGFGISGHITMRRWREGAEQEAEVRHFKNLITDAILDSRIGDYAPATSIRQALAYCRVGTVGAAVNPGDTALYNQVAATNNIVAGPVIAAGYDAHRGYVSAITTYQFAMGAAAGSLEEVGFGSTAAGDVLMSRALIVDENDNPEPLVVGAGDYLSVVYELRLYTIWDDDDIVQTGVLIDGEDYDITIRPIGAPSLTELLTAGGGANWTSFDTTEIRHLNLLGLGNNWLGAFEGAEVMPQCEEQWTAGVSSAVIDANTTLQPYVAASKERSIDVVIPAAELNLPGGISYLRLSTSEGSWGIGFTPPLAKVPGKTVAFTILVQALQRLT